MTKAQLLYSNNLNDLKKSKKIVLESGSLFYIDSCTKNFTGNYELKNESIYKDKIKSIEPISLLKKDGFVIEYVQNSSTKINLPILINDNKSISLRDSIYNNIKSEIENSRKLLFNSKNKMFLKSFLKTKMFYKTSDFLIKVSFKEYLELNNKNIPTIISNDEYYVNVNNILKYASINNKLGKLRLLFEDSLEAWKKKMNKLNDIDLYFYSRNLRLLSNEYNNRIRNNKIIKNLKYNENNIIKSIDEYKYDNKNNSIIKKKILTD